MTTLLDHVLAAENHRPEIPVNAIIGSFCVSDSADEFTVIEKHAVHADGWFRVWRVNNHLVSAEAESSRTADEISKSLRGFGAVVRPVDKWDWTILPDEYIH